MSQPWQALETLDDVATSRLSWQLLLGDELDRYWDFLVPIKQTAAVLPVAGRPYEWLEVCEVEDGVFEGYNAKTEQFVPVDRRDIICYEFNFGRLAKELARLVGFDLAFEPLGGPRYRFRLGHYGNPNGLGFPFYLAKTSHRSQLDWCVDAWLAETQRPFVLMPISFRMVSSQREVALGARGCLILPLDQALVRCGEGEWSLTPWALKELIAFRDRLMPTPKAATGRFPTPAGARWSDITIRFCDCEKISISVGNQRQVLTYAQLGLVDGRNGRPNAQWELLLKFASDHGVMTWLSPGACRKNRKQRELLNKSLRQFFDLEGDPIELTEDQKGWRCVFRLQPEGWERSFSDVNQPACSQTDR